MNVKTTNSLMKYLRNNHNIKISGKEKQDLLNIGYYHGYKGYRYIRKPTNIVNFSSFKEIVSLVEFDNKLKSIFYPKIMQVETITKNRVLQILVEEYKTDNFNEIYEKGMTDYRNSLNQKDYKEKMSQRLKVNNDVHSSLSYAYNKGNNIVNHFYNKDRYVPIWGIFETLMLGTFADLIKCLEKRCRLRIAKEMSINIAFDTDAEFPYKILYILKALRNSVAHNNVIFDLRFKDGNISKKIMKFIENETSIVNITFDTITDYIILLVILLKGYNISKRELYSFVNSYEQIIEDFRKKINISIFNQIIYSDNKQKLTNLKKYIKKS